MDEMDVQPVDGRHELVELVQSSFLGPPIELVAPVVDELLQIRQIGAVVPPGVRDLVWKADRLQPSLQVGEDAVRHSDREGHVVKGTTDADSLGGWLGSTGTARLQANAHANP